MPERLAPGSVLLHIGPYKTGTTSLQNALFSRQAELPALGVAYPGTTYRAARPGWGALNWTPVGMRPASREEWTDFTQEVRARIGLHMVASKMQVGYFFEGVLKRGLLGLGGRGRSTVRFELHQPAFLVLGHRPDAGPRPNHREPAFPARALEAGAVDDDLERHVRIHPELAQVTQQVRIAVTHAADADRLAHR